MRNSGETEPDKKLNQQFFFFVFFSPHLYCEEPQLYLTASCTLDSLRSPSCGSSDGLTGTTAPLSVYVWTPTASHQTRDAGEKWGWVDPLSMNGENV